MMKDASIILLHVVALSAGAEEAEGLVVVVSPRISVSATDLVGRKPCVAF